MTSETQELCVCVSHKNLKLENGDCKIKELYVLNIESTFSTNIVLKWDSHHFKRIHSTEEWTR